MITLNLNLTKLEHGLVKGKEEGETLLVIPIKKNNLFLSEKKNVYLPVVGFEFEDKSAKEYKDTHILKQSFKKDKFEKMTEEQRKALPIIGSARVSSSSARSESEPNSVTGGDVASGINELPF
jgi:hypothetical protein